MAAKILANLIVMGSSILARAFVQAYRQALSNASKNGVAQEAVQIIKRSSKTMTEAEARQILGVTEDSSWEEIVQKYDNLFEQNAKNGSFYLQSKVSDVVPVSCRAAADAGIPSVCITNFRVDEAIDVALNLQKQFSFFEIKSEINDC